MRRQSRIKIIGGCPTCFLFALSLAKLDYNVFLFDDSRKSNLNIDNGIFSFSNSSNQFFKNLNILHKLEEISFEYNSISIKDNLISEEILLSSKESKEDKKSINKGWITENSKVKKILIDEFLNYKNLFYTSENKLINNNNFDLVINFNNLSYNNKNLLKEKDKDKTLTLSFKVFVRGNIENRSYLFNTINGLILLIPLSKNIYQLFWIDKAIKIKERLILSKSQLLDNLTTLIPNSILFDQIIGEINSSIEVKFYYPYYFANKTIVVNSSKQEFNLLSRLIFNKEKKYINQLNKIIDNKKSKNRFNTKSKIDFFLMQFLNYLILNLFIRNTIFALILRKFVFKIFNKIKIFKNLLFKYHII